MIHPHKKKWASPFVLLLDLHLMMIYMFSLTEQRCWHPVFMACSKDCWFSRNTWTVLFALVFHSEMMTVLCSFYRHLPEIKEGAMLANILDQCMYYGVSLGRVGVDFRGINPITISKRRLLIYWHRTIATHIWESNLRTVFVTGTNGHTKLLRKCAITKMDRSSKGTHCGNDGKRWIRCAFSPQLFDHSEMLCWHIQWTM
jgi:hypothetical protein